MDVWEILGIEPMTKTRAIKRAYARKVAQFHPEDHPAEFQRIREAYERALLHARNPTGVARFETQGSNGGKRDGVESPGAGEAAGSSDPSAVFAVVPRERLDSTFETRVIVGAESLDGEARRGDGLPADELRAGRSALPGSGRDLVEKEQDGDFARDLDARAGDATTLIRRFLVDDADKAVRARALLNAAKKALEQGEDFVALLEAEGDRTLLAEEGFRSGLATLLRKHANKLDRKTFVRLDKLFPTDWDGDEGTYALMGVLAARRVELFGKRDQALLGLLMLGLTVVLYVLVMGFVQVTGCSVTFRGHTISPIGVESTQEKNAREGRERLEELKKSNEAMNELLEQSKSVKERVDAHDEENRQVVLDALEEQLGGTWEIDDQSLAPPMGGSRSVLFPTNVETGEQACVSASFDSDGLVSNVSVLSMPPPTDGVESEAIEEEAAGAAG